MYEQFAAAGGKVTSKQVYKKMEKLGYCKMIDDKIHVFSEAGAHLGARRDDASGDPWRNIVSRALNKKNLDISKRE